MDNKEIEYIEETFSKYLDSVEKLKDFNIGEFLESTNQRGCFLRNGNWFIYEIDERNYVTFCGPFSLKGVIYACAMKLHCSENMREFRFSDREFDIYLHNHFHTFEEIDKSIK